MNFWRGWGTWAVFEGEADLKNLYLPCTLETEKKVVIPALHSRPGHVRQAFLLDCNLHEVCASSYILFASALLESVVDPLEF